MIQHHSNIEKQAEDEQMKYYTLFTYNNNVL